MFSLSYDIEHAVARTSSSLFEGRTGVMLSSSTDTSWSARSSSGEQEEHTVEHIRLCSFAHHACRPTPARERVRRRTVQGGFDVSLRAGCDLSMSRLNFGACLHLEFGSGAAVFGATAEEVTTCEEGPFVGRERWSSHVNGEVDEAVSDMNDSFSPELEDEWRNWRLDHPELESD